MSSMSEPICEDFGCTPNQTPDGLECQHCLRPMVACARCSTGFVFPEAPVCHAKPECAKGATL